MSYKKNYRYSLLGRFSSIVLLVFISIMLGVCWKINDLRDSDVHKNMLHIATNISQDISQNIETMKEQMFFIGNLIVHQNLYRDDNKIFTLLKIYSQERQKAIKHTSDFNIWSSIGWSDTKHQAKFNSNIMLDNPVDLSHRAYCKKAELTPFKLCFDKIDSGYLSRRSIVPVLMSITDTEGKYIGNITSGIAIEHLDNNISLEIKNHDFQYGVINSEQKDFIIKHQLDEKKVTTYLQQFYTDKMQNSYYVDDNHKYVISRVKNSPFVVVIASKFRSLGYKDYLQILLPYKFEALFCLLMLFSLIYLFYQTILRPFLTLSRVASSIEGGDLNVRMDEVDSNEAASIASALEKTKSSIKAEKELAIELLKTRNSVSIANLSIENKVTERTQELEKLLSSKSAFLDHFNHEVMLPIQGINTIANNLSNHWNDISDNNRLEFVNQIAYSTNRLLSMVSNLLDLSKFTNNKMHLKLNRFDLTELTREIIHECQILYINKTSININFNEKRAYFVVADRERIGQVLRNLLVNAIRFSPKGGDIAVNLVASKMSIGGNYTEALQFTICDRGIGLDEAEIAKIFTPFAQGKMAKTRPGSVGLGLAICREIIFGHLGKIWAVNNKDGGATFDFLIPTAQPMSTPQDYDTPASRDLHHLKPNILMIDDEEICLESMGILLYNTKYNLITTNSGSAGLKYLQQHHKSISLILLDLMMPDMYGLNVLAELKKDSNLAHIPVILQTCMLDEEEIAKASEMGVASIIRKPYEKHKILSEIENAMKTFSMEMKAI